MARDLSAAAAQFAELGQNLRAIGEGGLRRELGDAIEAAAQPLVGEIERAGRLRTYMPARYADVLAGDLRVTTHKRTTGPDAGVTLFARAPTAASVGRGGRKIRHLEAGVLSHPLFGDRKRWFVQVDGMRPGFFTDPAERSAPYVRDKILEAMRRIEDKATGKG